MFNNYEFTIKPYGQEGPFGVKYESLKDEDKGLFEINSFHWTKEEVQNIISESKSLDDFGEYEYEVEDTGYFMLIKKQEVLMWARDSEEPDIIWTFEKFINFMEQFKDFIEKNS